MTERRRTPLQRAERRQAGPHGGEEDDFRNMTRRRQETEEKLRRHLEGERDGVAIEDDDETQEQEP